MSFYVQLSLLFFFIIVDYTNYGVISIFVSNWFIMESYEKKTIDGNGEVFRIYLYLYFIVNQI